MTWHFTEKIACARLKIESQQEPEEQCDNNDDFASLILKKKARVTIASEYHNLEFCC